MNWFPGPYTLASQVSKKNKALLIVLIVDGSEESEKMKTLLDSTAPSLFTYPVVPIKLSTEDANYKQFPYPTLVIPSTYFIDEASTVMKIVTLAESESDETFCANVEEAIKSYTEKRNNAIPKVEQAGTSSSSSGGSTRGLTLDEKVRRAKELLEKKRQDEEEKMKAEEREKELERIRSGKLMQEAAQKRQEQELVDLAAQRRREKLETEAEKAKVLAQIKADREEREYRLQRGSVQPNELPVQTFETPAPARVKSDRCRVQIRLPGHNSFIEEFASSDPLSTLLNKIDESGLVNGDFNLVTLFPRHVFSSEEMSKSFLELCLTPSCTLAVEQIRPPSSQLVSGNPFGIISYWLSFIIFSPIHYIFQMLKNFLGRGSAAAGSKKDDPKPPAENRPRPNANTTIRRRGNVSGLHNPNGNDSDDNANWNGNSTQFM